MKKILSFALVGALALTMASCGKKPKQKAKIEETVSNVTVEQAKVQTLENSVTYTGEIKASETTSVSAKASGQAVAVYKEIGDHVNAGDILVKIDDTDYRNQYEKAQAAYKTALASYESAVSTYNSTKNGSAQQTTIQLESALNSAKIEYNNAKTNYDNQKTLYESGAISKSVYDVAVTRFDNAKLALDTAQSNYNVTTGIVMQENITKAENGVKSAQAQLESAQLNVKSAKTSLDYTIVRAPISGYIASRTANKGQMVAQGVEVFSIKSTATIDAAINVTEAVIPYINIGTKASVDIKSANLEKIEGTVTMVSAVKDARTGMYAVSVAIDNADNQLKDGMFADITLVIDESVSAVVIPAEAVMEDEDGTKYVYIAKDGIAVRSDITEGIVTDKYVEAITGVSENDEIVVSGKEYLSEKNNKIKVVK